MTRLQLKCVIVGGQQSIWSIPVKNYKLQFEQDGFCIIKGAIGRRRVDTANTAIDAFLHCHSRMLASEGLLVDGLLHRVVNFHHSIPALKDIFVESMESAAEVTDQFGPATLYTSLFYELGSQQALHRDTPYFYSGEASSYMGVWAALDDADEENGALMAVKGSNFLGEPDLDQLKREYHPHEPVPPSSPGLFDAYNKSLVKMAADRSLETIVCKVQKGDIVIWNPSTLHGGLPHKNVKKKRRSFVMHITPQNTPMKQMDYFFDRSKYLPPVEKVYEEYKGRLIEGLTEVDFMHRKAFSVEQLGIFQ